MHLVEEEALAPERPGSSARAFVKALARTPVLVDRGSSLASVVVSALAGRSTLDPVKGDKRFLDPAWSLNPLYRRLAQAYLAVEQAIGEAVEDADVDWRTRERARFVAGILASGLAPTNTLAGNPTALMHAFDTGGLSLVRGGRNLLADLRHNQGMPRQVDSSPFRVGENVGATPGQVVYRNEVVEIIQYAPTTPTVHAVPLLIVWSVINRYYVLDLAKDRSFIEYAVSQGLQVFVTSWRNPGPKHGDWDLDTYAEALHPALLTAARAATDAAGVVDGRSIAAVFSWLRPNELVWNQWVNNYLMGKEPPQYDILAWNNDTTRLSGAVQRDFLSIAVDNQLATPGGLTVLGTPVDLGCVSTDTYVVGAETDHLVPWHGAYRTTQVFGGDSTFVLSGGGHIQHLVNPPGNPKAHFRTGQEAGPDPEAWLAQSATEQGTWWSHWAGWARARSGEERPAPTSLGSRRHRPIAAAPGRYVLEP